MQASELLLGIDLDADLATALDEVPFLVVIDAGEGALGVLVVAVVQHAPGVAGAVRDLHVVEVLRLGNQLGIQIEADLELEDDLLARPVLEQVGSDEELHAEERRQGRRRLERQRGQLPRGDGDGGPGLGTEPEVDDHRPQPGHLDVELGHEGADVDGLDALGTQVVAVAGPCR